MRRALSESTKESEDDGVRILLSHDQADRFTHSNGLLKLVRQSEARRGLQSQLARDLSALRMQSRHCGIPFPNDRIPCIKIRLHSKQISLTLDQISLEPLQLQFK